MIRRCMRFARHAGYDGIVVGNLFAGRAHKAGRVRANDRRPAGKAAAEPECGLLNTPAAFAATTALHATGGFGMMEMKVFTATTASVIETRLEPEINQWLATLPSEVEVKRTDIAATTVPTACVMQPYVVVTVWWDHFK